MNVKSILTAILTVFSCLLTFAENKFYIEDFSIQAGETKELEILLTNDVAFSAFQADIHIPEGLTVFQEDGEYIFDLSDRKYRNHTIAASLQESGAIRVLSYSTTSKEYSGNEGVLVYFTITASADFCGTHQIEINNIVFTQADETEYQLNPTTTIVTGPNADVKVAELTLNVSELSMEVGDAYTLEASVLPEDATNATLKWTSSDSSIATVGENGEVTAVAAGIATITVTTTDGSNLTKSCIITVTQPSSPEEPTECALRIKDAENGQVTMYVQKDSVVKLKFEAFEGWKVSSVVLNNTDVTSELDSEGIYVTPSLSEDAIIYVTYQDVSTNIEEIATQNIKVFGSNGMITIVGAESNDVVEVYNLNGELQYLNQIGAEQYNIYLPSNNVYIIKCSNKIFKVGI